MRLDEISGTLSDQPLTRTQLSSIIKLLDNKINSGDRKAAALKGRIISEWKSRGGVISSMSNELKTYDIDINKLSKRGVTII